MLEGLIKTGAFDSTGAKRSQLAAVLDQAVEDGAAAHSVNGIWGRPIFLATRLNGQDSAAHPAMPPLPNIPEWDQSERLKHERELTGFYISSHPLARYEATIQALATASTMSLPELSDGREVKLCGIITTVKNMLTKKGDRMAYLTLEDLQGVVEIIVFPDLYKNAADLMSAGTPRAHHRHSGPGR